MLILFHSKGEASILSFGRFRDDSATHFEDFVDKLKMQILFFYPGHLLFQGLSHVLLPVLLSSYLPLGAFRRLGLIQSTPRDPP